MVLQNSVNKFSDLFTADTLRTTGTTARYISISGTTIEALGTDADIPMYINSKGTFSVNINRAFISAGQINATTIGGTTPAAGTFTTLVGTTSVATGLATATDFLTLANHTITASGTDSNVDIELAPKGTGNVIMSGITYPNSDGAASGQPLVTDAAGSASFGVASVPGGGTGATNFTQYSLLYGNASAALQELGPLTNGQLVIGSTGNAPAAATLTAGTGISISNAAGSITISTSGGGFNWVVATGDTQAMAANSGYITRNATPANQIVYTLPATASIGDTVQVFGETSGGWQIAQNAGQTIHFGTASTTTGITGYIESTEDRDTVELTCITTDTDWQVNDSIGNIDVV